MSIQCKHCNNNSKNGIVRDKQRYKCKDCNRTFREGDLRERYDNEKRLRVIKWYRESARILWSRQDLG